MAKEVIGLIKCTSCGYDEAEVKETKKEFQGKHFVMVWCPHPKCQSQLFPRSKEACERIRAAMRPVAADPAPAPAPAPVIEPAPEPQKPRKPTLAEQFGI
jgi:hypothetical protein